MPHILIIDDETAIRSALKEILEYESYTVKEAEDGPSALKILEKESFDLIFCDIKMPKMDGIDFLGRLMRLRPMPVVMISTLTQIQLV
jgi:CheY-like chemotaxis protein